MRQNFRIKVDISKIFKDARKYSWVFIDNGKILCVSQLAEHVEKLFNIRRPFHFLSRHEDSYYFLPFEEDIRILENNDTVVIVPGTGVEATCDNKTNGVCSFEVQKSFDEPIHSRRLENTVCSEKLSDISQKSSTKNATVNNSDTSMSLSGTLYRTAFHETMEESKEIIDETKDIKMKEDDFTEDTSMINESGISNKRKRVRKRKSKKTEEIVPDSDTSTLESSGKKPKIIDSILISSGKHIRFEGLEDEYSPHTSAVNENNNNKHHNVVKSDGIINKHLSTLLNLRQSSTPIVYQQKRAKREQFEPEKQETININEQQEANITLDQSTNEPSKAKENSHSNKSTVENNSMYSFKVFKLGDDYTPQVSDVIIGKVLSCSAEGSQYSMKIFHGKEHLQDPEGKFSLPSEDNLNNTENDIVTLDKSSLLDFRKFTVTDYSS